MSCGFRLSFAHSAVRDLEVALVFLPDAAFASMEVKGFAGDKLAAVFQSACMLMGARFILLTSYGVNDGRLKDIPVGMEILHKDANFSEKLVDCHMK